MYNNIIGFVLSNVDKIHLQTNGYPHKANNIYRQENGNSYINQKPFHSVLWMENYISENIITEFFDSAISFNFGGCYMGLHMDFLQSNYIVSHIHTGSNDQKNCWKQYLINNECNNICIFKPYYNDIEKLTQIYGNYTLNNTWGVIDKQGGCYTINVIKGVENGTYKVIRVIQHLGNHSYNLPNEINWREDEQFRVLYLREI